MEKLFREIIEKILSGAIADKTALDAEKRRVAEELHLDKFVRSSEILKYALPEERAAVLAILQKKPMRTLSGVAVVAAMTQPSKCPHGKCRYCPGGPDISVPQSYTGKEPATRRAIRYGFDPFLQVTFRLAQLSDIGHPIGKVELIVMGGTLTAQMLDYQEWFVKEAIRAMNEFPLNHKLIKEFGEETFIADHLKGKKIFCYMEDVQEENEKAEVRCVGITFVVEATQQLKDSALKVGYHMMPGILGYNPELDISAFKKIIEDERLRPDMIKIYPCLILKGTEYYDQWKRGEFRPLETEAAVDLIVEVKRMLPPWIRTMRIQRDIPSPLIDAGIKDSNLGELVYRALDERNVRCRCIRCREVGQMMKKGVTPQLENIKLLTVEYAASGGREYFLSFEDTKNDILVGFLRLRIPHAPFRPEITQKTALIRELHVYGPMLEVGEKPKFEWQHRGYGKELLAEAEQISRSIGMERILVISGIGVRDYYRKFGYSRRGPYMSKDLI
jgi:elongator complex protein 3